MNKTILLLACIYISTFSYADMDVDDCDSLDFEACHTQKEDAINLFESAKEATQVFKESLPTSNKKVVTQTYEQPSAKKSVATTTTASNSNQSRAASKTYEIRERYTLTRSNKTPYSAFYVIESLHKQMAELCPNGWEKLREWSVPVESDYYMHYIFECR